MTLFLVFGSLAEADAVERVVFERGAQIAAQNGYAIDEAGGIVGMTPKGEPTPDAARTTRWDEPRRRVDGRWVFTHPQHHSAAREPAWIAFVMDGITAPAEEEATTWWPTTDDA